MELLLKYNLRSLLVRRITSAVTVAAVGLVVGIVVVILALLRGLQATLLDTGSPDNVIVLRRGAIAEASSAVTQEQYGVLRFLPQVRRDAEGEFLASPELVVQVGLETPDGRRVFGLARGLRARVMAVHDQVQLVSGAWARSPGEAVVGRALGRKIGGGVVGTSLRAGRRAWKVAGVFAAGGSGFESELWVDADDLKALYKRSDFSSVTVKLSSAAVAGAFQDAINTDPRLKLTAKPLISYHAILGVSMLEGDRNLSSQMLDESIRIDPRNPDKVWVLGSFGVSIDAGKTFRSEHTTDLIHTDHHALWIDPNNTDHLMLGNDGGLYFSYDGSRQWEFIDNLPIGQYYDVDVDTRDPYWIYGGTQDNGTWGIPSRTSSQLGITNADVINVAYGDCRTPMCSIVRRFPGEKLLDRPN